MKFCAFFFTNQLIVNAVQDWLRRARSQRRRSSEYSEADLPWRLLGGLLAGFHERAENQRHSQRNEERHGGRRKRLQLDTQRRESHIR